MKELLLKGFVKLKIALSNEEGSVVTEYGLLIALIVVLAITAITNIGTGVQKNLTKLADVFD